TFGTKLLHPLSGCPERDHVRSIDFDCNRLPSWKQRELDLFSVFLTAPAFPERQEAFHPTLVERPMHPFLVPRAGSDRIPVALNSRGEGCPKDGVFLTRGWSDRYHG